ncbi:MAG: hypothetical protein GTN70_08245 [Deltaproteobacteria bacterium]|nr:hypothetical protein [Deltaproteobacteria bacterium]NIS77689.1 hypothetical protein [Deltaproteobacteria bacterium]
MDGKAYRELKEKAIDSGAAAFGACPVSDLGENREDIERIFPGAVSVLVVAAPHSRSAIASEDLQVAQFDTIHTYGEVGRIAHGLARRAESMGYRAVAVPAFIPIDMSPPKSGMVGAVDWRAAGVCSGIGSLGESGLLVTETFGPAVRICGVVTDAALPSEGPLAEGLCLDCMRCVDSCPAGALMGKGEVDRKKCGATIFSGGYRAWRKFLYDLLEGSQEKRRELLGSQMSLDLWQNFMSGNYYYCFACQAVCPVGSDGGKRP